MNTATLELPSITTAAASAPALKDLLQEGIYLLFLLRNGNIPASAGELSRRIDDFLALYEKTARNFGKTPDAIESAKYAFCALLDETILSCEGGIRDEWERAPLQLRIFGEHLAGEGFFERLELLRMDPDKKTPSRGRPVLPIEDRAINGSIRLTPSRWAKLRRLGVAWLARVIDRAKE